MGGRLIKKNRLSENRNIEYLFEDDGAINYLIMQFPTQHIHEVVLPKTNESASAADSPPPNHDPVTFEEHIHL